MHTIGPTHTIPRDLPPVLRTVAKELVWSEGTCLRPLPAGTTLKVSRSAAEGTARKEFGRPRPGTMSTFALSATDNDLRERQRDGTLRREIVNRPVWVVLYPKRLFRGSWRTSSPSSTARRGSS